MLDAAFWSAALRSATPIYYGVLGGALSERAGVLNIGLEGFMLFGAITGTTVAVKTGSLWLGVLAGFLSGLLLGMLLAVPLIFLKGPQIVIGLAFNVFALGGSIFIRDWIFGLKAGYDATRTPPFPSWRIPVLADLPWVGEVIGHQTPLSILILVLAPLATIFLFRTAAGLAIRTVGEHARAADTLGIPVQWVRFWTFSVGSGLAALGGVHLSLVEVRLFLNDISHGRGYIALVAIILGRWHPLWGLGAALVVGAAEALAFRLQAVGVAAAVPQLTLMLPYVITLAMMFLFYRKVQPPAEDGIPYVKE